MIGKARTADGGGERAARRASPRRAAPEGSAPAPVKIEAEC